MALLTYPMALDAREIAKRTKRWLDAKEFETKVFETGGSYVIKARKASTFRAIVGADRALEIGIRSVNGETQVDVRQGSWKTNAISNVAWVVVTGGMNLAISGWSIVIQKELEGYLRKTFDELAGTREVNLD